LEAKSLGVDFADETSAKVKDKELHNRQAM
jgi:hypothetical protein